MKYRTSNGSTDPSRSAARVICSMGGNEDSFYDSKSGLILQTALALVLWWIVPLGQMIAGYVGGRRAGSVTRGLVTSFVGSAILIVLMIVVTGVSEWMLAMPNIQEFLASAPAISFIVDKAVAYASEFASLSSGTIYVSPYFSMLCAFGMVGGAMANQSRKEIKLIVAHTFADATPAPPRSMKARADGRPMHFDAYSDYNSISVNSVAGSEIRAAKKQDSEKEVKKVEKKVETKNTEVTATAAPATGLVAMTTTTSSVTVSDANDIPAITKKEETQKEHTPLTGNDFEYL